MERPISAETPEKDAPLRYDTRLLGRILGDTVRAQEGEPVFERVEHIRRMGVQFHRDADEAARRELQAIMSGLPTDQAIRIIRAFGYFSHLANIAEDQHHIRRTRAYALAQAPPRPGTMAYALGRARSAGISRGQLQAFFAQALCSPVLTAHPTEIRRKSSIDREMEIAWLLDQRDRIEFTPEELAANRRALRRAVLTLWQTNILRGTRLRVIDEVANGLAYYDHTFLRALPGFYADLEDHLGATDPAWQDVEVPSFPAHGQLDRRRSRRATPTSPPRYRARRSPCRASARAVLPSRRAASAGRRTVARWPHRAHLRCPARAGRPLLADKAPERQRRTYRRAIVGIYAAGCHRLVARPAGSAAPAGRDGAGL
jgi:phosphoenolpyruvate carboxylase